MDDDQSEPLATRPQIARHPVQFGVGIFTAFVAGALALAALAFIWLGVFPSLVVILLCVPLALLAARMIGKGRPENMP